MAKNEFVSGKPKFKSEILVESLISLFNNEIYFYLILFHIVFPLLTWNYSQRSFFNKSFLIKSNWNFSAASAQ